MIPSNLTISIGKYLSMDITVAELDKGLLEITISTSNGNNYKYKTSINRYLGYDISAFVLSAYLELAEGIGADGNPWVNTNYWDGNMKIIYDNYQSIKDIDFFPIRVEIVKNYLNDRDMSREGRYSLLENNLCINYEYEVKHLVLYTKDNSYFASFDGKEFFGDRTEWPTPINYRVQHSRVCELIEECCLDVSKFLCLNDSFLSSTANFKKITLPEVCNNTSSIHTNLGSVDLHQNGVISFYNKKLDDSYFINRYYSHIFINYISIMFCEHHRVEQ
jgi:hypothetical protein